MLKEANTLFPRRRESSSFKQKAFFLLDSRLRGNDGMYVMNYGNLI